jgi:hypothetical protein
MIVCLPKTVLVICLKRASQQSCQARTSWMTRDNEELEETRKKTTLSTSMGCTKPSCKHSQVSLNRRR